MFRDLRADEIECRVAQAKENGVSLLLYKDARCDQNILDETVGPMFWQRHHVRDNANCIVSIWSKERNLWVSKEDTGTESNTEKEKGLASDSFKRACFNWGIGRELYTAPFIWVNAQDCKKLYAKKTEVRGKEKDVWKCDDDFYVQYICIKGKRIVELEIKNRTTGKCVFVWPSQKKQAMFCKDCGAEILPYTSPKGNTVSVERHCTASFERYGRVLCLGCIDKAKA